VVYAADFVPFRGEANALIQAAEEEVSHLAPCGPACFASRAALNPSGLLAGLGIRLTLGAGTLLMASFTTSLPEEDSQTTGHRSLCNRSTCHHRKSRSYRQRQRETVGILIVLTLFLGLQIPDVEGHSSPSNSRSRISLREMRSDRLAVCVLRDVTHFSPL